MRKKRKISRKIVIVIGIILAVLLAGFFMIMLHQKEEENVMWTSNWLGTYWFNENGAFEMDGNLLYFLNPQTGKRVVACNKVGCDHNTKNCPAYSDYMTGITFDSAGMLYFSNTESKFDSVDLLHIDSDGTNLKKLHSFRGVQTIRDVKYYDNQVFFSYSNQLDEDGNDLELPEAGIILYDMESGKEKTIFSDKKISSNIQTLSYYNGVVYFTYSYSDMTKKEAIKYAKDETYAEKKSHFDFYSVNIDDGEYKMLAEKVNSTACIPIVDNVAYICLEDGVYAYDTDAKNLSCLQKGEYEPIPVYRNGKQELLLFKRTEGEKTKFCYFEDGKMREFSANNSFCLSIFGDNGWFLDSEGNLMAGNAKEFLSGNTVEFIPIS